MGARYWLLGLLAAALFACGGKNGSNTDAGDGSGSNDPDGGVGGTVDAPPYGGECTQGGPYQCSDCLDNDMDGKKDGFDPECTGPNDNREDSFATGIPGDNMDATTQDCFFDGNSGQGGGDCNQHVCCLLQAGSKTNTAAQNIAACKALNPTANADKYDINKCYKPWGNVDVPAGCAANCGPLAPPGCDCFGCCTVCNQDGCRDILLNTAVSPTCDQTNITSPGPDGVDNTGDEPCKRCVMNTDCGSPDCSGNDPASCILCPGQDPSTLPSSCNGDNTCPPDVPECDPVDSSCPPGTYCSTGCCVGIIL